MYTWLYSDVYLSGISSEFPLLTIRMSLMTQQVYIHRYTYIHIHILPYIHTFFHPASFEWFRERCGLNSSLEENKDVLKDRITEAKTVGERANQSRYIHTYIRIHTCIHTYMHAYIAIHFNPVMYFHFRNTITYLKNSIESIRRERWVCTIACIHTY